MAARPSGEAQLAASGVAALINFPLWKASAVGQAGFRLRSATAVGRYFEALRPPWKGALPVVLGMTWARAAIFYGADVGRLHLERRGVGGTIATAIPVLATTSVVQVRALRVRVCVCVCVSRRVSGNGMTGQSVCVCVCAAGDRRNGARHLATLYMCVRCVCRLVCVCVCAEKEREGEE